MDLITLLKDRVTPMVMKGQTTYLTEKSTALAEFYPFLLAALKSNSHLIPFFQAEFHKHILFSDVMITTFLPIHKKKRRPLRTPLSISLYAFLVLLSIKFTELLLFLSNYCFLFYTSISAPTQDLSFSESSE